MDWNCTLTEERLSDYLEGQLGADESAALTAHRQSCARCADLLAQVSGLLAGMHGLEPIAEPAPLQRRILDATLGPKARREGWRRWFAWSPALWQPRFAIGIVTVAVCAVIVIQAGGVLPSKMHKANVNPADIVRSINRKAHLSYARGVKFVNDLRVVYEIESRLETQNPPPPQGTAQPQRTNPNGPQEKSDQSPGRSQSRKGIFYADAPSAPGAAPARKISFIDTLAPARAYSPQPTSETLRDRRETSARQPLLASPVSSDPNLNRGFSASPGSSLFADSSAQDGPAAAAWAKPEWSAP